MPIHMPFYISIAMMAVTKAVTVTTAVLPELPVVVVDAPAVAADAVTVTPVTPAAER